jgi:O-antigen/teichoic acid export membrane protein
MFLFKNTAAQSLNLLTSYLFSLLIAPVMLHQLGLTMFGVWAVTGAMATYAGLADFGITRSLARFIAIYDVDRDDRAIAESVGLGLIAITVVTVLAAALALVTLPLFAASLDAISEGDLRIVLLSSVAVFSFTAYRRVLNSVETGLLRMVPPNVANVFTNVVNFAFSLAALLIHPDLATYAVANALSYLVGIGAAIASVRHVWGAVPLAWPSRRRAREIMGFGVKAQVHGLSDLINLQTDKIILAFAVGVRAAASYEIAARVVTAVRSVGLLSIAAMIPTFAAHIAQHGRDDLRRIYRRYTRLAVGLAFPVYALTCVMAPLLLQAWLGDVPLHAPGVVVLLTLAYLCGTACEVAMNIATSDGRPGLVASNSILPAGVNMALTLALAPVFGFWGVLAGTVVAMTLGSAVFMLRYNRAYGLSWGDFLGAVVPPALLSFGVAAIIGLWVLLLGWGEPLRLTAVLLVLGITVGYTLIYWPIASRLGFLPEKITLRPMRGGRLANNAL